MVVLGAVFGANFLLFFDSAAIGKIIVVLLPLGILATFMPKKDQWRHEAMTSRGLYVYLPLICLMLGFYEVFFGPGAGSFFILALHFFCVLVCYRLPQQPNCSTWELASADFWC